MRVWMLWFVGCCCLVVTDVGLPLLVAADAVAVAWWYLVLGT